MLKYSRNNETCFRLFLKKKKDYKIIFNFFNENDKQTILINSLELIRLLCNKFSAKANSVKTCY